MLTFATLPLLICAYEMLSLILPLKISLPAKILASLILISGLAKLFLLHRTPNGFEIYELHYILTLAATIIFNFIIVAFFLLLMKDFCQLFCRLILRRPFPNYYASLFVLSIALCATLYGTYEGLRQPDVKTHEVAIKNLGREFDNFKIAMMVDIHADVLTNRKFVQELVRRTNALQPDLILMPGDFVDGTVAARSRDLEPLKDLRAKYGVYGTTGNHEYYYDFYGWLNEFPRLGIKMLNNEHIVITSGDSHLVIAGVPDQTGSNHDTALAVKDVPENSPVILMDHRPVEAPENSQYKINLQLSGHTHGGQMPVIYSFVKRFNRGFVRGWYEVNDMKLFVSPGTSQWNGFALRLFDPAEISLLVLKAKP